MLPGYDRNTNSSKQAMPLSASFSPPFKLRPRSNSHPVADAAGFSTTAFSPAKPQRFGAHTISPDCHKYSTSNDDIGHNISPHRAMPPPPSFASFFGQGGTSSSSPIKKQKTHDRLKLQSSPDTSPSESEESPYENSSAQCRSLASAAAAPVFPPLMTFPLLPADNQEQASSRSSHGKRNLPPGEEVACGSSQQISSPFTPKGRQLMQNLCLNSPSPTLSSVSPTPENTGNSSNFQLINQNLPSMPTFSFSPSLKDCTFARGGSSRCNTVDSSVRETIIFSTGSGSTPLGTPKRGPSRNTVGSANSSPFLSSLRSQRTPIGHQRGSVFKMPPPRLYPNSREDALSIGSSANENTFANSSAFSSSPSPRVVPLTVLSRNGSPVVSPKTNMSVLEFDPSLSRPVGIPSPLMRSLDQIAKEDSSSDFLSTKLSDVKMPSISMAMAEASHLSSASSHHLPRIKLTPRGKKNFASVKLDSSPGGACDGLAMPRLSSLIPKEKTASSLAMGSPDDKAEAEMDSLLNGFEHHKGACGGGGFPEQEPMDDTLNRVESEEAEMVALTQGPFHMPALWLPSPAVPHDKNEDHHSSFTCSDGDSSRKLSPSNQKPMPSITLNLHQSGQDAHPSQACGSSPSFLPRPIPVPQNKSRSLLFDLPNARDCALERIIRADAIAEAARSDEPLTDEDSDVDGDDADFLLCLPQPNSYESHPPKRKSPLIPSCADIRVESYSFNKRAESPLFNKSRNGSFTRRSKFSDNSLRGSSPTIFEGEFASIVEMGTSKRPSNPIPTSHEGLLNKRETSDATFTTFCSLSDCDASEIMASPKYLRTKALGLTRDRQSKCSLLSMSSLCGLDIVHEASLGAKLHDKVPALMSSESAEFSAAMFKPLHRSEFSMNSLGLSVDSADAGMGSRDLFTPPITMGGRNTKQVLSPPPLRCRVPSPLSSGATWL
eukprot:CAMPEP_0181099826 /NCGR_PEP_ID=MMETSP1071-20121207/12864_1 /TAXON_ID=35127 /ORGANISM="Thalassiosira sp., Strain NH16" /LENGTH=943 /DNA_ID=CAMNT_0023182509 /DNA_START=102 /DNA_END=2932 /DNA_ORIENTATION=+